MATEPCSLGAYVAVHALATCPHHRRGSVFRDPEIQDCEVMSIVELAKSMLGEREADHFERPLMDIAEQMSKDETPEYVFATSLVLHFPQKANNNFVLVVLTDRQLVIGKLKMGMTRPRGASILLATSAVAYHLKRRTGLSRFVMPSHRLLLTTAATSVELEIDDVEHANRLLSAIDRWSTSGTSADPPS
ncbi:MAG: hypothetical protein KDB40_24480 [Acidimicrobiales bacterium]|nr:hypothetical protein [Acidimicrobiales bacterium]MCB9392577.1 hypothetical protein [Acidimicrobiaceae bacterium]